MDHSWPHLLAQLIDGGGSRGQLRIVDEGSHAFVGRGRGHEGLAFCPASRDASPPGAKSEKEQSNKAFSIFASRFMKVCHGVHSRKRIRNIALGDECRGDPKGCQGARGFNRAGKGCFGESSEGLEMKVCGHVAVRS